ncbi:tRNA uridine-5-carboxymethylaminomethyl(34) synthesis enzyme MnmG [Sphingomonas sp. ASV193]|uniref:tRNA uridine-5-carboxymethylaminomethyl(34) synthesis enzyme MnmG n=1 Tax=Sphingomonas sp. ASV193 TaxID=3144405 RepID=UPI0032E8ABC8
MEHFDVVVIGGGHAGVEAACAARRRGATAAIVTFSSNDIGRMSCNPSIGGVGKGHLVREVDALGGVMAQAADRAAIHYRMLNASKGAAIRGPRIQADRRLFAAAVRQTVQEAGITVIEGEVVDLVESAGTVVELRLASGNLVGAGAVVVATGTFLGATMFRGRERWQGGRLGDFAATRLGDRFAELGLAKDTLKTGTPPRLDGRTIDWARLTPQPSDREPWWMSLGAVGQVHLPQLACAITATNPRAHAALREGFDESPLLAGEIEGRGPRYCPSIEDKLQRFADRDHHQIFLEPEGLDDTTVYPNGISTSLSTTTQETFLRAIVGLERVRMTAPGYAVEYRHADPRHLDRTLAHRDLPNLFLAGQINGTTGYEEAAAQGLVAGANAAAMACGLEPLTIERGQAYLGVMIEDLTLHGISEPYRMLTARSEHRLSLRADNAWSRLGPIAEGHGLLDKTQQEAWRAYLKAKSKTGASNDHTSTALDVLAMAEAEQDNIYAPYIERNRRELDGRRKASHWPINAAFDYGAVPGLSNEMRERLESSRPETLEQAERVRGISPAAIAALHFALAKAR